MSKTTSDAPDLSLEIAGVKLPNPLVLASGILGTHASLMSRVAEAGAGAITAKSAGPVPRGGHVNPTCLDFGAGLINAIGLANPGAEAEVELLVETKSQLSARGVPIIASIFADSVENFGRVAETIAKAEPDLIEVNISCPNVESDFGEPFAGSPESAASVTRAVKAACDIPIIMKLAPNVPSIARIALAVEDAGADSICAVNTMPGMLIDAESGLPILQNRSGGVSGPALLPVALYSVYRIASVVKIPIIGTGGVSEVEDVVAMLAAGATAVGLGTAAYYEGAAVFDRLNSGLSAFMAERQLSIEDLRGRAHGHRQWTETATPAPVPHASHE